MPLAITNVVLFAVNIIFFIPTDRKWLPIIATKPGLG
jgi:hypothetical protein